MARKTTRIAKMGDEKFLAFSSGELASRRDTGYWSNPESNAPSFEQIKPQVSGKSSMDASFDHKAGNLKFSKGPRG